MDAKNDAEKILKNHKNMQKQIDFGIENLRKIDRVRKVPNAE